MGLRYFFRGPLVDGRGACQEVVVEGVEHTVELLPCLEWGGCLSAGPDERSC